MQIADLVTHFEDAENYNFLTYNLHHNFVIFRTAIEAQLLGCRTVVVEARTSFTRNNVLKLWKFLIEDLKMLGVKKLYGKFASGNINHISIKVLQTCLLKVNIFDPIIFASIF